MKNCKYCDKKFSGEKEKLEHELNEHAEEMSGHDRSEKKSELNRLKEQKQAGKRDRKKKLQLAGFGVLFIGLVAGGGVWASQNMDFSRQTNASIGVGTPVHWHADYRITVCGENQILRGGPLKAHTHGEQTFHLEGVRNSREEATLDWIVDSLGGNLEENSIMGRDGCNGEPANLTVTVNGEEVENHLEYIPRNQDSIRIEYS